MTNLKKIIVPTDFSECAKNALKVASDIAKKSRAEIHLVHVYERPVWGFAEANLDIIKNRQLHNRIVKELHNTAALPFMKGIEVTQHIFTDLKIYEALNHPEFHDADLIVMGSHGTSGWRGLFIGSNAEKVVRYSEIPVLVIKEWMEHLEIKNIVFASGFYSEEDGAFMKIEFLANIFAAKIHLLKIITPANFESSNQSFTLMKNFARRFYLADFSINVYNEDTVESGVLNFSKQIQADLIAMETHGRTGLSHFINGSITENLVNHLPAPVLSVKIGSDKKETALPLSEQKII